MTGWVIPTQRYSQLGTIFTKFKGQILANAPESLSYAYISQLVLSAHFYFYFGLCLYFTYVRKMKRIKGKQTVLISRNSRIEWRNLCTEASGLVSKLKPGTHRIKAIVVRLFDYNWDRWRFTIVLNTTNALSVSYNRPQLFHSCPPRLIMSISLRGWDIKPRNQLFTVVMEYS